MQINCYLDRDGVGFGDPVITAFAKGHGGRLSKVSDGLLPGLNVFWGILRGNAELIRQSAIEARPFLYIDHAYIGRGHENGMFRTVLNNHQDTSPIAWGTPDDRLGRIPGFNLRPWVKGRGDRVLICPPTNYIAHFFGVNGGDWLDHVCRNIVDAGCVPIVRPKTSIRPLDDDLGFVRAVATFNSSVALKALEYGIPVYTSNYSAARRMGYGIEHLYTLKDRLPQPEGRLELFKWLAYKQFHVSEMEAGIVLKTLGIETSGG